MKRTILLFVLAISGASFALAQSGAKSYTPPKTPDGQPDLQGNWTNATLTPFQRPAELAGKEFFTPEEAAAFERQRVDASNVDKQAPRSGDVGAYNNAWWDRGTHVVKSRRTSLIIDPPDGRIPPLTPEAKAKFDANHAEFARHPADGPEDRPLTERCILFGGTGPPMLPEPYNNNYQIVQSPGYVTILSEMNHEARIVPLDNRPHVDASVREWIGDSRGHWDGNTLVVETTNLKSSARSRFGVAFDGMSDQNMRVTERFTRVDAETILYQATVSDPTVYTKPWTVEISMSRRSEPLYEYACHEGNYGMFGILSGERAKEKAAAGK